MNLLVILDHAFVSFLAGVSHTLKVMPESVSVSFAFFGLLELEREREREREREMDGWMVYCIIDGLTITILSVNDDEHDVLNDVQNTFRRKRERKR